MTLVALKPQAAPLVPAALAPFLDPDHVAMPYPLFLPPPESGRGIQPLGELLSGLAKGQILRDNLRRLELAVRRAAESDVAPVDARDVVARAAERMAVELRLADGPRAALLASVDELVDGIPAGAYIVGLGPDMSLELAYFAAKQVYAARAEALRRDLQQARDQVASLLAVEVGYDQAAAPQALGGAGTRYMDAGALASIVGHRRGTVAMDPVRRARLEEIVATLTEALDARMSPSLTVVLGTYRAQTWSPREGVRVLQSDEPCRGAQAAFDERARALSVTLGALRAARLELAGAYDPAQHDELRKGFSWSRFTEDELRLVAPVFAVLDDHSLVTRGLSSVSQLLASERPVQVLVEVHPSQNPGRADALDGIGGFRVEPGFLALAHRQAYVQQASIAAPEHLFTGLATALERARPGVHLVDGGYSLTALSVDRWLAASAAITSRALPLFHYDPVAGERWADSMDVSANPSPDDDWSAEDDGSAFTFAHYAVLDAVLAEQLRPARPDEADRLVPVSAWLDAMAPDTIPVVWAQSEGVAVALVPSEALLEATIDRRRAWRTLQELGGYANEHAKRAAEAARAEVEHEAAAERDALVEAHREELDRVRRDTAREAMQRLAAVLLDADALASATPARGASAKAAPAADLPAAPPAATPAAAPAPAAVAEEPWVDSVMCTSCNDCMQVNAKLFVYDDNKQARIGDPKSGTFSEIVRAAEKCPARCIHPGAPLNPNEPGLAELIARAVPFQ